TKVILPTPKTVVDESSIAAGWDGGFTLPGESLSRRRPADNRNEPQASHRTEGRSNLRKRTAASDAVVLPQVVEDSDGLSVESVPEEQPEVVQAAHPEI